jgi:hypothetical protein
VKRGLKKSREKGLATHAVDLIFSAEFSFPVLIVVFLRGSKVL